jgi:orotidine-5'-phosphate decarboxylase
MTNTPNLRENPVFVALDTPDLDQAVAMANAVRGHVGGVKTGLEFFSANGAISPTRSLARCGPLPDLVPRS